MAPGKVNRKELTLIADVLPMQYDLVIKRTLREAQGMLWANLPPASNLPDAQAVKSLRALVRTPQVHQALKRGNDTALLLRAPRRKSHPIRRRSAEHDDQSATGRSGRT